MHLALCPGCLGGAAAPHASPTEPPHLPPERIMDCSCCIGRLWGQYSFTIAAFSPPALPHPRPRPHIPSHGKYSMPDTLPVTRPLADGFKIVKQYTRLAALWPRDALRPNLPFTRAIDRHGQPFGLQPTTPVPEDASKKSHSPPPAATPAPSSPPDAKLEQAQVNALFSLLENRYTNKYPLSPAVLKPTSAPGHYIKLMEEIERAPQKTWWQAKVDEWKMKIRWS